MHRPRLRPALASLSIAASMLSLAPPARALDDCPPGSTMKNEQGFSWCEPKVCAGGVGCSPNEVCVDVPLCVQVGTTGSDAGASLTKDAGTQRLVATQRCGPDNTCPQLTTCLPGTRCVSRTVAERTGLLAKPAGSAAPAAPADAPKKNCGCRVPGGRVSGAHGVGFVLALGLLAARRRRRRG